MNEIKDTTEFNSFAVKYLDLYNGMDTTEADVCDNFAEQCWDLGLKMDCGESFGQRYPKAFQSFDELEKVIDEIDDYVFLGNAIFSQWRYVTHWSYNSSLLDKTFRPWFKLAFERLVKITAESGIRPKLFRGQLSKIQITSNVLGYGPCPEPDDEIEQRLTINHQGKVWISRYAYGDVGKYELIQKDTTSINKEQLAFLFEKYTRYFSDKPIMPLATDVGSFELVLTNTESEQFKYKGSIIPCYEIDDKDLSAWTREILDCPHLFVFDGNAYDRIEKLRIDYHRNTLIHNVHEDIDLNWIYDEYILIDREAGDLELYRKIGSDCNIKQVYHIGSGIGTFLDDCCADIDFEDIEGIEDDAIIPENETKEYTLTIDYFNRGQIVINNQFSKKSLPSAWPTLMSDLKDFLEFYGIGEIMDPLHYCKEFKTPSSVIFLSVVFGGTGKSYYYLTDDDSIEIGDQVIVPVGNEGKERIVDVVKKQYFQTEEVPMPIEKVKSIIGIFNIPEKDDDGNMRIHCPLLNKKITADECYAICVEADLHDFHDIEGLITRDEFLEREEICEKCKYNLD